jgi:hypothetical protein
MAVTNSAAAAVTGNGGCCKQVLMVVIWPSIIGEDAHALANARAVL